MGQTASEPDRPAKLTRQERDCLRLVGQGYTSKEIAPQVGLSPATVDTYLKRAVAKFGVASRAEAARVLASCEQSQSLGSPSPGHDRSDAFLDAEPAAAPPAAVREPASSPFVVESPNRASEQETNGAVGASHLRTLGLIVLIASGLAVLLLALGPLVSGARDLANAIQPHH